MEKDYEVGKAPKRKRCPECNKLVDRFFGEVNFSFKDDGKGNHGTGAGDFWSVKQRYRKFAEQGYDKDSAHRFLNGSIQNTKNRLNTDQHHYKPANINYEALARDGKVRKLNSEERRTKLDNAAKLTEQAYDNANKLGYKDAGKDKLDISRPLKQQ